jgi:hypothetical protein
LCERHDAATLNKTSGTMCSRERMLKYARRP